MIILDTNVISELMRSQPNAGVLSCIRAMSESQLLTTSITAAEILFGIRILAEGQRKAELMLSFERLMLRWFRRELLSFDEASAEAYSKVMAETRRIGRPMAKLDGMIAGIAISNRAALATRNVSDFTHCGLTLIDPWAAAETSR